MYILAVDTVHLPADGKAVVLWVVKGVSRKEKPFFFFFLQKLFFPNILFDLSSPHHTSTRRFQTSEVVAVTGDSSISGRVSEYDLYSNQQPEPKN